MAKQVVVTAPKPNIVMRLIIYLQEVRAELDKVTWPSRDDLKAHTLVVMFFLVLLAVFVGGMDVGFQRLVLTLFSFI